MAKNLVLITTGTSPPFFSKELLIAVILSITIHVIVFFALVLIPADNRNQTPNLKSEILIDLSAPAISEPAEEPEEHHSPVPPEPATEAVEDTTPVVQEVPEPTPSPEPVQRKEENIATEETQPIKPASPARPGPEEVPAIPSQAERQTRARDRTLKELYNRLSETLQYPPAARRRGTEGIVELQLHISPEGELLGTRIISSSGSRVLDNAALSGIRELFPYPHPIDTDEPFFLTMHITFALN